MAIRCMCLVYLFAFACDILIAHSQEIPNEIKTLRGAKSLQGSAESTEAGEVTASSVEEMLSNVTAGKMMEVCGALWNCGFQPYSVSSDGQEWIDDGPYIPYCRRCVEGYTCERYFTDMSQKMYIYQCSPVATTTPVTTQRPILRDEAVNRRVGLETKHIDTLRGAESLQGYAESTEAGEVTAASIEKMLSDVAAGETPEICYPYTIYCAFQTFSVKEDKQLIDGPYVPYCRACVEGYTCERYFQDMTRSMYIYMCLPVTTTTAVTTPTSILKDDVVDHGVGLETKHVEL